jgi:aromatic ring-cleaving dioxygenase
MMTVDDAPYHAHIYFTEDQRGIADDLRTRFQAEPNILFVGAMTAGKAGPHPLPQYEVHFLKSSLDEVVGTIRQSGLRALVHPLTDDDLANHTTLGQWIGGDPLELDLTTLDPPGMNQGIARFGKTDF